MSIAGTAQAAVATAPVSIERREVAGVADMQRTRMIAAAAEVCAQHGAANVTVGHIVARAGVSRRTFYELFGDCRDCLAAVFENALGRACEHMAGAWQAQSPWRERARGALVELLSLFDRDPVIARLLIVESLVAGPVVSERRLRALAWAVDAVDEARRETRGKTDLTRLTAEGVVGGVLAVLYTRIAAGESRLIELVNPLMSMLVLPYYGVAAARRELERPRPALQAAPERPTLRADPFKTSGTRLTYRTMRVLRAIANRPGLSNRQVGIRADIHDQGQISKLLARLERVGLIANQGAGGKGEPNVWTLTDAGRQVVDSLRTSGEGSTVEGSLQSAALGGLHR